MLYNIKVLFHQQTDSQTQQPEKGGLRFITQYSRANRKYSNYCIMPIYADSVTQCHAIH